MTFRVKKTPIPRDLIEQVRKEYSKGGTTAREIKKAIIEDMEVGVSPVEGQKWTKYSDSYKSVIRGEKTFRRSKEGSLFVSNAPDTEFLKHGKGIAPVNLKLSGGLYKSIYVNISTQARKIVIGFKSYLAEIHNKLGAGKVGNTRRMLPTEAGEKLNSKIMQVVISRLEKAVSTIVKKYNGR